MMSFAMTWLQRLWFKPTFNPLFSNAPLYPPADAPHWLDAEYPNDRQVQTQPLHVGFPYQRPNAVLSKTEQRLYKQLHTLLHNQGYIVLPKVRLADVLTVATDLDSRAKKTACERLRQKKADFVVCRSTDFALQGVILADLPLDEIKLDTQSHNNFVSSALAASNVFVLQLVVQKQHSYSELKTLLQRELKLRFDAPFVPVCPVCMAGMRKVMPSKGRYAGKTLWLCQRRPHCNGGLNTETQTK